MKHRFGKRVRQELKEDGHDIKDDQTLQEYAISWLLKHEGVTCVLLGARRVEYVKPILKLL